MKNLYFLLFLLSLLYFNCDSPTEYSSDSKEYFPLKIGNKWYYNSGFIDTTNYDETLEIVSQKKINGNIYYETVRNLISNKFKDTLYYRFNGNVLYLLDPPQDEIIIADFSLKLNEVAYWDSIGDLIVSEKTDSIITFSKPFSVEYGLSVTYKKEVGLTKFIQNGYVLYTKNLVKWEIK